MTGIARPEAAVFDGVASVALGDTLLTLWQTPAHEARIRSVTDVAAALLARTPGTSLARHFLLPTARPPGWGERHAIRGGVDLVMPRARRLVTAPPGDAAWHGVVRAVLRAGVTLIGRAARVPVAGSPDGAVALLGEAAAARSPDAAAVRAAAAVVVAGRLDWGGSGGCGGLLDAAFATRHDVATPHDHGVSGGGPV